MTAEQLSLDLWPLIPPAPRPVNPHQRGHIRLPCDTAGLGKTGDIVPAWVCCQCGGVEPTEFMLEINHRCEAYNPGCRGRAPDAKYPFNFRPYWIPPTAA